MREIVPYDGHMSFRAGVFKHAISRTEDCLKCQFGRRKRLHVARWQCCSQYRLFKVDVVLMGILSGLVSITGSSPWVHTYMVVPIAMAAAGPVCHFSA